MALKEPIRVEEITVTGDPPPRVWGQHGVVRKQPAAVAARPVTVGELVEVLRKLPQDAPVLAEFPFWERGDLDSATAKVERVAQKGSAFERSSEGEIEAVIIAASEGE